MLRLQSKIKRYAIFSQKFFLKESKMCEHFVVLKIEKGKLIINCFDEQDYDGGGALFAKKSQECDDFNQLTVLNLENLYIFKKLSPKNYWSPYRIIEDFRFYWEGFLKNKNDLYLCWNSFISDKLLECDYNAFSGGDK